MLAVVAFASAALSYSSGGGPGSTGQTCDAITLCAGGTCPEVSDYASPRVMQRFLFPARGNNKVCLTLTIPCIPLYRA